MKAIFFLDKAFPSNHSFVDDFLERYFSADELVLSMKRPRSPLSRTEALINTMDMR